MISRMLWKIANQRHFRQKQWYACIQCFVFGHKWNLWAAGIDPVEGPFKEGDYKEGLTGGEESA